MKQRNVNYKILVFSVTVSFILQYVQKYLFSQGGLSLMDYIIPFQRLYPELQPTFVNITNLHVSEFSYS